MNASQLLKTSFFGLLIVLLATGCSSIQPYQGNLPNNISVKFSEESVSGLKGRVDVYALGKQCNGPLKGSVKFKKTPVKFGVPVNSNILLSFQIQMSHWLKGQSTITIDAFLKVNPNSQYDAQLTYVDRSYGISLYETNAISGVRKEIVVSGLESCREQ